MRHIILFLITTGLLYACKNDDTTKVASNTTTINQLNDPVTSKSERQIIIEELKGLEAIFASKDKEQITDIFHFPLSDTTVGIYIDNNSFNDQFRKNGDKATRAMFLQYFPEISQSLQIDHVNKLFKKINIENLLQKDTLEFEAIIKTEPCYHSYGVIIEKDLVTLTVETNSNKDYKSKTVSSDEVPENSSEFCEHIIWWLFEFDGKKLHFKKIMSAG